MRSAHELAYRLRQELVNLKLLVFPPNWNGKAKGVARDVLSDPASVVSNLSSRAFPAEIEQLAADILSHRLPLLGTTIETDPVTRWRRDYVNAKETGLSYFRLIPYLDFEKAGDHKWIWELNRHQHLVVLAQAYLLFERQKYLDEICKELESWWQQNPFQRGINWASALEVGFRAVSWLWILHLAGPALPASIRQRLEQGLHLHGLHLENNVSLYFSPNTHLLGEAVALHAIGRLLPHLPRAQHWAESGRSLVEQQMAQQVREDGSHFEQSTYYQVYALDMLLFHAILSSPSQLYLTKLGRMADYLDALMGNDRRMPLLGDDDGGRWFHPYGDREEFGRATLATCSAYLQRDHWPVAEHDYNTQACWWLNCQLRRTCPSTPTSVLFHDAGLAVLRSASSKIVIDCGPFGRGSAGHSHADTLSFTVTVDDGEILIDPGTFTYVAGAAARDEFRGTAAHNTVRLDSKDQADAVNPFRWANPPQVRVLRWSFTGEEDILEAECTYRGFVHRRYFHFVKPLALLVLDEVAGPSGEHLVEQFWHLASDNATTRLKLAGTSEISQGWRSRCFSQKEHAPVICVRTRASLPVRLAAAVLLDPNADVAITHDERNTSFKITSLCGAKTIDFNGFSS